MMANQQLIELEPGKAEPASNRRSDPGRMRVTVVFTTIAGTLAALEAAANFARHLNAEIVLVVAEVIYFRYPLENPPVPADYFEKLCVALVDELEVDLTATRIEIHFCRDQVQCLQLALGPRSLVVLGAGRRWWSTRERRLERALTRTGHRVILVSSGRSSRPDNARTQSVVRRLLAELTPQIAF